MNAGVAITEPAQLTDLQRKGDLRESGLHLCELERTEIASVLGASTIRLILGDAAEERAELRLCAPLRQLETRTKPLYLCNSLRLGARDAVWLSPRFRVSAIGVLSEDVAARDFRWHPPLLLPLTLALTSALLAGVRTACKRLRRDASLSPTKNILTSARTKSQGVALNDRSSQMRVEKCAVDKRTMRGAFVHDMPVAVLPCNDGVHARS
mmetsp:Transcript_49193/g.113688  ORF Transcript_49193/g.113688 Transcript_49193/m.113688 type:complete len:210 (-) Transcript_49193:176-805(-)